LVRSLRVVLQPYLSLLRLDDAWGFFAPVGKHSQFRYVVEDDAGKTHVFVPTEEKRVSFPRYVWWREFKYFYDEIMQTADARGREAGILLCREHASLRPRSVVLLEVDEQDFTPEDELRGNRPLDPEFVTIDTLMRVKCEDGSLLPPSRTIRPLRKPS